LLLLFERLYEVHQHLQQGRFHLPEDEMRRFGVQPSDFMAAQTTDRIQQLFAFQAERIHDYHRRALETLPDTDRCAQCSLLIRLLEQRICLTPLRKL
jgi:phytoene synthase